MIIFLIILKKIIINFNEVLQNTNIYNLDYIKFIMEILPNLNKEKTLIYLDPPYNNVSNLYFKDNETIF